MSFKDHFSTLARNYAEFRPRYPRDLFDFIASLPQRRDRAWDCATGNGQAAVDLAADFDHVIATDASAKQIEEATPHERVEYRVAPAEACGIESGTIDAVTVAQSLHWFDIPAFFAEARRVLRSGGAIVVWGYGDPVLDDHAANEILQRYYRDIVGPYWPPERRILLDGYRVEFPFDEVAAPDLQLELPCDLEQLAGYFGTWSATRQYVKALGENPVDRIREPLESAWGDPEKKRRLVWPVFIRAGRA